MIQQKKNDRGFVVLVAYLNWFGDICHQKKDLVVKLKSLLAQVYVLLIWPVSLSYIIPFRGSVISMQGSYSALFSTRYLQRYDITSLSLLSLSGDF